MISIIQEFLNKLFEYQNGNLVRKTTLNERGMKL